MTDHERFPVVLLWHMHQPNYRDALTGSYRLPWTVLHAIKDYVDMAAHLEANPQARAVVNFTPVLVEQLQELAVRSRAHLVNGSPLPDPVLAVLGADPLPEAVEPRLSLLQACLRANRANLIDRYPAYAALAALSVRFDSVLTITYASDQYLRDLGMWFHLAWLGETVKRGDARVAALLNREYHYTPQHCRQLLELIVELLEGVLPRYRALAQSGQIEVAVSPFGHPIMPLLLDFRAVREAQPGALLPHAAGYPDGERRVRWHLQQAVACVREVFGAEPWGCWPSEGAISDGTLNLIAEAGFGWMASGGSVLHGTLAQQDRTVPAVPESHLYLKPHAQRAGPGPGLYCLYRHDELSDLIGFTYSTWHGDDAVAHFVAELERTADQARAASDGARLLLIALDGENAWEHYPFNGFYFLRGLYAALANHPRLKLSRLSDCLVGSAAATAMGSVRGGSWVHGTLATWMGDADKNRGWDLLVDAKRAVDAALASGRFDAAAERRILLQLAHCESSDWFWWFGDYNPAESVRDFDQLFRHQLASLYQLIGSPTPAALAVPVSVGNGAPEGGGVMRRSVE
jgi:alpha-amylase/alpha-mannosidase (GH57 family)